MTHVFCTVKEGSNKNGNLALKMKPDALNYLVHVRACFDSYGWIFTVQYKVFFSVIIFNTKNIGIALLIKITVLYLWQAVLQDTPCEYLLSVLS